MAPMLSTASPAMIQNTTTGPKYTALAAASAAETALPAWLKASFRPMRREKAFGPTTPRVMAASAGGKIAPAMPATDCVAATAWKLVMKGSARQLSVTARAAAMTMARLCRLRSISAPAGVWASRPATPAMVMTRPMVASFQPCSGPRTARR